MIKIHHGPGVEAGVAELLEDKTLVRPPYRDLKVDAVRELMEAYTQPWPYVNPTLVAGPLDEANPSTLDILLKRIEEPLSGSPELVLWAYDFGSVPDTIRSRCGEVYHFAPPTRHRLTEQGERLYGAIKQDNLVGVSEVLGSLQKEDYRGILEALVEVMGLREDYELYTEDLKGLLRRSVISQVALYGHFMGVR